jgi:hypothetical protein
MVLHWEFRSCRHTRLRGNTDGREALADLTSRTGFVLVLANAAHVKNVPGRKTDLKMRCSWPNYWHTV